MLLRIYYRIFRLASRLNLWFRERLTKGGALVLTGLIISAGLGVDTIKNMVYQAFSLLAALFLLALLWSLFFRAEFRARRKLPRFGTVGEPLDYKVYFENLTGKVQRGLFLTERPAAEPPSFADYARLDSEGRPLRLLKDGPFNYRRWGRLKRKAAKARPVRIPLPDLPPQGGLEAPMTLTPTHRGVLRLESLTTARPDPFGLVNSIKRVRLADSLIVLPRRYVPPPLNLPGNRHYQPGGVALASSVGDSEEFVSLRDYRPGDPLRRIHWKSWAKTEKPVVKEYQDEFFIRHALILDTFIGDRSEDLFEEAVSVAASFACSIITQDSLLDLVFVGDRAYCFTSGRGLAHTDRMMEILASARVCRGKSFRELQPVVLKRASLLSACICVFLGWDEDRKQLADSLVRLRLPLQVLVIADPAEGAEREDWPDLGPHVHVLETGRIQEGLAAL